MIFDYRASREVRENGATLCIQWRNGVIGRSEHLTYQLMVRYLRYLHSIGEDVSIISVQ